MIYKYDLSVMTYDKTNRLLVSVIDSPDQSLTNMSNRV
jgi:uncharacterized protein YjiK